MVAFVVVPFGRGDLRLVVYLIAFCFFSNSCLWGRRLVNFLVAFLVAFLAGGAPVCLVAFCVAICLLL